MKSFLQNQHAAGLAGELAAWLEVPSPQNYRRFAIADMSMLDTKMLARMERHTSLGIQILETSRYAAYEELGPRLIPLDRLPAEKMQSFLSTSDGVPALSFVELLASEGIPQLQSLIWLAEAEIADGMQMYCRYTDTRILPVLLDTLTEDQTAMIGGTIRRWAWFNREGALSQKNFAATKAVNDVPLPPLSFDDQQFSSLMQAAEADLIFSMLRQSSPEIIPETTPFDIHRRLLSLLEAGRERGVIDAPDQLQFVAIAWSSSETFYQLPCLAQSWENIRNQQGRFSEVLKTWDDSIWEQIDALKPGSLEAWKPGSLEAIENTHENLFQYLENHIGAPATPRFFHGACRVRFEFHASASRQHSS
ncbi:DUF4123 domain-containing protein [Dechloromonas denitrificans]|uniref:DUF4123 domain-containing protein n=1 Tax=Dechloromonas denitrificans TaxID=281362 RepID=UPI00082E111B|nr:DUF4123 domain-containing protein [Dechloromonas denitrificans]